MSSLLADIVVIVETKLLLLVYIVNQKNLQQLNWLISYKNDDTKKPGDKITGLFAGIL